MIYQGDSRELDKFLKDKKIDLTVTSPPYFDMKDYGVDGQLGYGQKYERYIEDLKEIFQKIFVRTSETGSLYIIIDTLKRNSNIILLPFDLANECKKLGWLLQDIIVWEKDRTVPWIHKGRMRNKFEYILFFTKTKSFKYNIDELRQTTSLEKWWITYPERYNPLGKAPTGIWHYPIPTQGSWGEKYLKHFCPLPTDLVNSIIRLSSDEGDMVFDPFSGTGTVPICAESLKRKFCGIEINSDYINIYKEYRLDLKKKGNMKKESHGKTDMTFYSTIMYLRALKKAKQLIKDFNKMLINDLICVCDIDNITTLNQEVSARLTLFSLSSHITTRAIEDCIQKNMKDKYGLNLSIKYETRKYVIKEIISNLISVNEELFLYQPEKFFHFTSRAKSFQEALGGNSIVSNKGLEIQA